MQCADVRIKLSAYLDGEASPEERALVYEHLRDCPACREALAEIGKTVSRLRSLDEVETPPWFTERVMRRVEAAASAAPKRGILQRLFYPLHLKLPAEAIAVVMVAAIAFFVYDATRPEMSTKLKKAPAPTAEAPAADSFRPAEKPFAPASPAREPEKDLAWHEEEIGQKPAGIEEPAPEKEEAPIELQARAEKRAEVQGEAVEEKGRAGLPEVPYYYGSFSGYHIPFRPSEPLSYEEAIKREAYYIAYYDDHGRILSFSKYLHGELFFKDEYYYRASGQIEYRKTIKSTGEIIIQYFDEKGKIIK